MSITQYSKSLETWNGSGRKEKRVYRHGMGEFSGKRITAIYYIYIYIYEIINQVP